MKALILSTLITASLSGVPSPAFSDDVEPDNSGTNVRDREADTATPGDQSNAKSDVRITQEIRKAVVAEHDLSINAQNVKIITVGGVVTLRGPVKSAEERTKIATMARAVAGVVSVENQLEIASR